MPPPDQNRLVAWFLLIKDEWLPSQKERLWAWCAAARAEPYLIWQTPQVRYGTILAGALAAILSIIWFVGLRPDRVARNGVRGGAAEMFASRASSTPSSSLTT